MRLRIIAAGAAAALVLAAAGVFFAGQDLGRADQWASVASFFLALVSAAVSVLAALRRAPEVRATYLQTGKGARMDVVIDHGPPPRDGDDG